MRFTGRHLLWLIALAALASLAALLLIRPPVAAPGSPHASPVAEGRRDPVPPVDPDPWNALVWRPVDGAFPSDAGPLLRVDGLIDTGGLLVGWGRAPMEGRNQFNDMGAVFLSRDGTSWQTVPVDHAVNHSELQGVAVGPGGFLAHGGVCCQPEQRAFWHSPDGSDWTRLELGGDLDPSSHSVRSVVGTADAWIAVGSSPADGSGRIWRSTDGLSWESVLEVDGGGVPEPIVDVAVGANGLVAVGTVTGPDGTYDGAIWTSMDGSAWERVAQEDPALVAEGEAQLSAVVAHAGGLFVTGMLGTTEQRVQCEQLGMVASVEVSPPVTATSCVTGAEYHWISPDGTAWRGVDPDGAGPDEHPIEFRLVVPGGPGLVVLGEGSGPASPDTSVYTSPDGERWTAVEPLQPIGAGVGIGLAVRGRQLIAVADHFDGSSSQLRVWLATAR
jgi:hypothetical protein